VPVIRSRADFAESKLCLPQHATGRTATPGMRCRARIALITSKMWNRSGSEVSRVAMHGQRFVLDSHQIRMVQAPLGAVVGAFPLSRYSILR
jgi:hypothetical protein